MGERKGSGKETLTPLNPSLVFGRSSSSILSHLTHMDHRAAATTLNSSSVSRKSFGGRSIRRLAAGGFGLLMKCVLSGDKAKSCCRVFGCFVVAADQGDSSRSWRTERLTHLD